MSCLKNKGISIETKMVISCVLVIASNYTLEWSNGKIDIWWGVVAVILFMFIFMRKQTEE